MRQSGAFFGFLQRASTSEHGIAGHDRLALSVRTWRSCSIAAMLRLKSPENVAVGGSFFEVFDCQLIWSD